MFGAVFSPRAVDKMLTTQDRAGEHFTRQELKAWSMGRQIRDQDFPPRERSLCSPPSCFLPSLSSMPHSPLHLPALCSFSYLVSVQSLL